MNISNDSKQIRTQLTADYLRFQRIERVFTIISHIKKKKKNTAIRFFHFNNTITKFYINASFRIHFCVDS